MRWVRPDFTIPSQARAFRAKVAARASSASTTRGAVASAARRMAVGMTSFVDCARFTSSFGSTERSPRRPPRISAARLASTSFTFMWKEVPAPAW